MRETLNMGLLLLPEFQWLDAAGPVDLLTNHSFEFISRGGGVPQEIVDKAPNMNWYYISSDLKPVQAYSGPPMLPTTTFQTCPSLNYLVIPGTDPTMQLSEECLKFLQTRYTDPELRAFLMVCSGSIAVAQAGILDGLNVCSNKFVLRTLATAGFLNKNVKWVGNRRWIVDGKIWSAAGVTAGIDLAAEFVRVHFDKDLVKLVLELSEYSPLPDQPDSFAYLLDGVDLS